LRLYTLMPSNKFIAIDLAKEAKQHSIKEDFINILLGEKIIAINEKTSEPPYRWDSIHPNIFMVKRLLECEDTGKYNILDKKETIISSVEERTRQQIQRLEENTLIIKPIQTRANPIPDAEKVVIETLRNYQNEGISKIFSKWKDGKRSVLFQMPTGTGKTVLFNEIVHRGFKQDRKILIVVHRIELVEQTTKKLLNKGIPVSQIVAGKEADYSKTVQVASIQTFSRREQYPEANLIIIDECHHAKANTYKKLWGIYPNAKFLGVTATPYRLSGEGF